MMAIREIIHVAFFNGQCIHVDKWLKIKIGRNQVLTANPTIYL